MKKKLLILIVAYFAEKTLADVVRRIPAEISETFDCDVLILDDASTDETFSTGVDAGRAFGLPFKVTTLHNPVNQGYGGNQKLGYHYAIENGFDFVALLHGDGQYAPEALPQLLEPLANGEADAVFGSRMMESTNALRGGMPFYKFFGNRILTWIQNAVLGSNLSEFHSGYRVYRVETLSRIPFERNTNVFHFDTEIIIQLMLAGARIRELPIPTYYGDEICYVNGLRYAFDVVKTSFQAKAQKINLFYDRRFDVADQKGNLRYTSKLAFDSSHSRVVDLVKPGSRVLDLGAGVGEVGAKLKREKGCLIVGCDIERSRQADCYDEFVLADLNLGIPKFRHNGFNFILAMDVIEHLRSPEEFLDELRALAAETGATVILTTANIGFVLMRALLLFGRFEYGKRGILDLTHTRLFTVKSLRRAMASAGLEVDEMEGVPFPAPFVFGRSIMSRGMLTLSRQLCRLRPSLFGFQLLVCARARPTLESLLTAARKSAEEKLIA